MPWSRTYRCRWRRAARRRAPRLDPSFESAIAVGWSPGGFKVADDLEAAGCPQESIDGAMLGEGENGIFGCEGHGHQGRTTDRHGLFPSPMLWHIHAPKHEKFDLVARTNTDPKGIVRAVDVYTVTPWGLYMARPTPGRAQFHYLESWLLPSLGLARHASSTSIRATNATRTTTSTSAATRRADRRGIPRTTIWIWSYAPAKGWNWLTSTSCSPPSDTDCSPRRSANRPSEAPSTPSQGLSRHGYDLHRWLSGNGLDLTWRGA